LGRRIARNQRVKMPKKKALIVYISKSSPKEARRKSRLKNLDPYVVDISKIVRDLEYDLSNLTAESEFILNYTIRKKISQGIYSTKCDSILVCYKNITSEFENNLGNFLSEMLEKHEYSVRKL
jgi:hypothetical protein